MAKQGLLAQLKPSANTDTVLYSVPINRTASTVLTIANDGTGSAYDVALKNYDQKFTLDAATYKLHEGDVISSSVVEVGTAIPGTGSLTVGSTITTTDQEKSFKFESFYTPPFTEIFVKVFAIRSIPVESITGAFAAGDTISKGTSPNDTTAVVYGTDGTLLHIGPSTLNGTGAEFAAGDSIGTAGGASATISASPAITAANNEFAFSTTTAGGVYNLYMGSADIFTLFDDRTYRFNVADATMSGRDFHLSETINGEYGPDGDASTTVDNGTEYATGKTTNGTAGSGGAYVQYAFGDSTTPAALFFYDGGTGTASNANYGGVDRILNFTNVYTYPGFYVFDKVGTIVDLSLIHI